jgi:hypothetical protein
MSKIRGSRELRSAGTQSADDLGVREILMHKYNETAVRHTIDDCDGLSEDLNWDFVPPFALAARLLLMKTHLHAPRWKQLVATPVRPVWCSHRQKIAGDTRSRERLAS